MRASEFLDTLGVNTHIDSAPYDDTDRIVGALAYLGIRNVRQSSPIDAGSFAGIQALGQAGYSIDLIINGGGPVSLPGAFANVVALAPYLNAVENVNEAAIYPIAYAGLNGVDAAVALQKDLYAAVKADPRTSALPVLAFTIGGADPAAFPSIGDISPWADYANIHSYPPHGMRPIFVIHAAVDGGRTDAPSRPVMITETGYYTLPNGVGWGGVPESVQASYLLDLLLDEAAAGIRRTYLYDLLDDGPDPAGTNQEAHFGLFHMDGSPKLSATAIHNLTTILADPAGVTGSAAAAPLAFTAHGVPYDYTGNTLLLDKADGSRVIAVWNEQQLWDTDTLTASPAVHLPVTLDLGGPHGIVYVFDPMLGAAPIRTLHAVDSVALDLTDHPLLVQVMPDPVAPPPMTPGPGASTDPGGSGMGGVGSGGPVPPVPPPVAPPPTTGSAPPLVGIVNARTGTSGTMPLEAVGGSGGPGYLEWQYIYAGSDPLALSTAAPNVFLHGGAGNDALQATSGRNVLDGGAGSNFLTGGSGTNTFFTDARGDAVVWNTLRNFHAGDAATLWGFTPGVSSVTWDGMVAGAAGSTGATLRANIVGGAGRSGDGVDASITFAGLSVEQAKGLQIVTGTQAAGNYLYVYNPGV